MIGACSANERAVAPRLASGTATRDNSLSGAGGFQFTPLTSSAVCTNGGSATQPFLIPAEMQQTHHRVRTRLPGFARHADAERDRPAGRALPVRCQRSRFERIALGHGSRERADQDHRTALGLGSSRSDRLDAVGHILIAEETNAAAHRDPDFPNAVAGLVYEIFLDPSDPTHVVDIKARPAIGSKSHEGMRFDTHGNLYSISERTPGYIFKFVPDTKGDLSSGQTYVMKLTQLDGDRTGTGIWVPLDRDAVQIDASAAADAVGATGYGRPEDVEIATSSGNNRGGAADAIRRDHERAPRHRHRSRERRSERRRARVQLRRPRAELDNSFVMPDNLALDHSGNLYITEDPGGSTASGKRGDDIWVAAPATATAQRGRGRAFRHAHGLRGRADRHLLRHRRAAPVRERPASRRRSPRQDGRDHADPQVVRRMTQRSRCAQSHWGRMSESCIKKKLTDRRNPEVLLPWGRNALRSKAAGEVPYA